MNTQGNETPVGKLLYPEDLSEVAPEHSPETDAPGIRNISPKDLGTWLGKGWRDLWQLPAALAHGLVMALVGLFLMGLSWSQPWLAIAFMAGFLLVGPVFAVGVNYMALQKELGESAGGGLGWLGACGGAVWGFAAVLAGLFAIWASFVWMWIAVLNVGELSLMGQLHELLGAMLSTGPGLISLAGVVVFTILFGLVVFAVSLATLPALIDHRVRTEARQKSLSDAIGISLKALNHNRGPLLLWGLIITALFMVSLATAFLALIVIFPWLGFAMWHGYRDLVAVR